MPRSFGVGWSSRAANRASELAAYKSRRPNHRGQSRSHISGQASSRP